MNQNKINSILSLIAQKHLGIETLKTRKSDQLDFYDLSVWQIQEALNSAFIAGKESCKNESGSKK